MIFMSCFWRISSSRKGGEERIADSSDYAVAKDGLYRAFETLGVL